MELVPARWPSTAREGRGAHRFDMTEVRTSERSNVFVGSLDRAGVSLSRWGALIADCESLNCLSNGIDRSSLLGSRRLIVMFNDIKTSFFFLFPRYGRE